jgi:hypothetical protein
MNDPGEIVRRTTPKGTKALRQKGRIRTKLRKNMALPYAEGATCLPQAVRNLSGINGDTKIPKGIFVSFFVLFYNAD